MNIEIDFTKELTNTHFAPLAVLSAHYQSKNLLEPLHQVQIPMRERYFSPASKLIQVLLSILAGCETLSEVNTTLKQEPHLARVWGWEHFADQSSLSRTLDELTLKNIESLRTSSAQICKPLSAVHGRDWRPFLWLDFDLTALPCGPLAQESQKGYFGEKKAPPDANWPASVRSKVAKRSGRTYSLATPIPCTASVQRLKRPKLL
jgi:hypothetical protein